MTVAKMRVYEIAREVGLPNKELITRIRQLGLQVNNHMSSLEPADVERVKRSLEKDKRANTETKRLSSTVIRRRSRGGTRAPANEAAEAANGTVAEAEAPAEAPPAAPVQPPKKTATAAAPAAPKIRVRTPEPPVVEPVLDTDDANVVSAEPAPEPEPQPEPQPELKVTPVEPPVEVVSAPEPIVAPSEPPVEVASEPVEAESAPTTPIVVDGPQLDLPKRKRKAAAPPVEDVSNPEPVADSDEPKQTVEDMTLSARDRFQAELERARNRVAEREAQKVDETPKPETEEEGERDPSRPAVGSVIRLPVPRIKITQRAPNQRQMPGQGQIRDRFAQQRNRSQGPGRRNRDYNRKKTMAKRGPGKATQITTPAEHKRVIRIEDTVAIPDLAKKMGVKANEVLRKLWGMGMVGININATIDFDTAQIIATEFQYEVQNVAFKEDDIFISKSDEDEEMEMRAPIVTVMGHVDHGKTSLLDYIREAHVTKGESGGITQHVAAYRVNAGESHGDIVFLDTPGHEAFTEMRARGAQTTDIVVLVVAADDGAMPQTVEALNHAKDAGVTIIVAINKCDLPGANPEQIRKQLGNHGLIPEEWGGDTMFVEVSALKGDGVDKLLEAITLSAEIMELKANPDKPAVGVIIEAKLDRSRGPMATVLVQEGTLKVGDIVVSGEYYGRVRAILAEGKPVKVVGPATPVELLGLDGVPGAGESLNVADDEKVAKQVVEHRRQQKRKKELATTSKVSLENIMEKIHEGDVHELKIVLKTDVQGSAEAMKASLIKLSTDKVKVNVIQAGVGGITESDVNLAKAGGAVVVGFHVRTAGKSAKLAEKEGVEIKIYDIIYEALDDIKAAMAGMLAPIQRKHDIGQVEVRETWTIPRKGVVGGCMVTSGKVLRKSLIRVVRDAVQVHEGKVGSLRRFKDDVAEVQKGFECGVMVDGFSDLQIGDILEVYEIVEERATL